MSERPVTLREPGPLRGGMLCPVCGVALVMADKQGVEIDYCPTCRGIWLDRGEIEKIVERSIEQERPRDRGQAMPYGGTQAPPAYPPQGYPSGCAGSGGHHGGHHGAYGGHGKHRRRSWLSELFD